MYRYVLTDLRGTPLTELPSASSKTCNVLLKGMGYSSVVARGDWDDADALLGGDRLLRIIDESDLDGSRVLLGHHRLVTAEENGAGDSGVTVAATFADPYWMLVRRIVGASSTGYNRGTASAPVDVATILAELVGTVAAGSGLRMGVTGASITTYVAEWFYKPLSDALTELTGVLGGPDWRIRPTPYDPVDGTYGELDVLPAIGGLRPDAAFEYGDGLLNVAAYKRAISYEGTANRFYGLPAGFPDNALIAPITVTNPASQSVHGLLEAVVSGDLSDAGLINALLGYHSEVRQGPQQTITFTPVRSLRPGQVPRYGVDFAVGDVVPFRASITRRDGTIAKRIDVSTRVYGYGVTVDDVGAGTGTLTTTPT